MSKDTSDELIADSHRLTRLSFTTQYLACQVCGHPLHEGDDVTAYAYRAAGEPPYEIGYIMCGADVHEHPTVFTRGVREHVVSGHIGTCSNTRTQSTSSVPLDPTVVVTSPMTTSEPHIHPGAPIERPSEAPTHRGPIPLLTTVREPARPAGGSPDGGSR